MLHRTLPFLQFVTIQILHFYRRDLLKKIQAVPGIDFFTQPFRQLDLVKKTLIKRDVFFKRKVLFNKIGAV